MKGIDVSTVQGKIDWQKVYQEHVDFAMIKATQGRGEGLLTKHLKQFADSKFTQNITGASSAGISCGVYHYFTATDMAAVDREAKFFIETIEPYRSKINLWAAVDVESKYIRDLDKKTLTRLVDAFLARLVEGGYKPMLYTNPDFLTYRLNRADFEDVDIWLAHWGVNTPMNVARLMIWQYGTCRVAGVNGDVDGDQGYFVLPWYKKGGIYTIKPGDVYTNGISVPSRLYGQKYTIIQVKENAILLDRIMSWVKI